MRLNIYKYIPESPGPFFHMGSPSEWKEVSDDFRVFSLISLLCTWKDI